MNSKLRVVVVKHLESDERQAPYPQQFSHFDIIWISTINGDTLSGVSYPQVYALTPPVPPQSHTGVVHPCTIYSLANGAIVVEIHDLYSPPELLQAIFPHSKHLVRSNLKALYGDLL